MAVMLFVFAFIGLVLGEPAPGITRMQLALILLVGFPGFMALMLLLIHYMGTVHAMQDLDELLGFLRKTIEAEPREKGPA